MPALSVTYENLRREMAAKRLTLKAMSQRTGILPATLGRKLSKDGFLLMRDAAMIRSCCFPELSLEYLFFEIFAVPDDDPAPSGGQVTFSCSGSD